MSKFIPLFIAFLFRMQDYNGRYTPLVEGTLRDLEATFPDDVSRVREERKNAYNKRQAELEAAAAGSPEARAKQLRDRIAAAEAELAILSPRQEAK